MKKIFTILGIASAIVLNAQAFTGTYEFNGTPFDPSGVLTGAGSANVTISNFSNTGYATTTTGNRFAHSDAPTANTPDLNKYFEVTVTPAANYSVSISSMTFRSQRSGTGPRYYIVRSNVDSYAANLPASINPANPELEVIGTNEFHFVNDVSGGQNGNTVTPTTITNITTPVTFRFYFYEAEAAGGTFSVDDVVIDGTVTSSLGVVENFTTKSNFVKNTQVADFIHFGSKADVKIYNMNGQVVKTANVSDRAALDASDLTPGMYIVTGTVEGKAVSQKILKK